MILLKNCRLIPELTEGTELTIADVAIEGEYIKAIEPAGSFSEEADMVIDLRGKTLMPGLIDMHTHLRLYSGTEMSDPLKPCEVTLDELEFAQYYLENGYTTVRDVGDNIQNPAIAIRNFIKKGRLIGPRIFCSGPTLTPTEFGADAAWSVPNHYDVDSPMEMRKYVRYNLQKGSDFIKLYGSGSMMHKDGQPGALIMEPDEMEEAVKMAERKHTYCAIHMHGTEGCDIAAHAGVRTIEHASYISEETLRYLETLKGEGHGIVPTVSVLIDESWGGKAPQEVFDRVIGCLSKAVNYDILIGWGTDTSLMFQRSDPYAEFRLRKENLHFSNLEILKQVTINSATLMMQDAKMGTVKVGKYADLIVIDGKPDEDITAMYQRPEHVIKGGAVIR
ncbi:MAG: amidohydrolase family protein [Lachnospiraceae bacterium]|nr:amidohydrolase family protein [Lachnospiraceae bacterium]